MSWIWRKVQRQPALLAGALLVIINLVALSGVLHLSDKTLGGVNAALAALLAFLVTLVPSVQLSRVRRTYVQVARERPWALVPTAGSMIGHVVGRDDLCRVLMENLRDRRTRRPQLVVGGVGTGKTALLVRLTLLLAEQGFVPVPVALEDTHGNLDFSELARRQFIAIAPTGLLSDADVDKVWRQLRQDDKVVILADGLEALMQGATGMDRESVIREAVRRAYYARLPLIITSRPHDVLRGLDCTITRLPLLDASAALAYVEGWGATEDVHRLLWIVETADAAEAPLYLQVTRQLHRAGLIGGEVLRARVMLDTRGTDRAGLRFRLLQTWEQALIGGILRPWLALSSRDREATIEQMSLLAFMGLQQDRFQVKLDNFDEMQDRSRTGERPVPVLEAVERRLSKLGRPVDMRLAATRGEDLGLVELQEDCVRFPHRILQSYLGARLIDAALADRTGWEDMLRNAGPELLTAVVMYSRAEVGRFGRRRVHPLGVDVAGSQPPGQSLAAFLIEAAGSHSDVKALDLYSAAFEVDSVGERPAHSLIADVIERQWASVAARDPRILNEAKLNLVHRYGEAARIITRQRLDEADPAVLPAYRQLFHIACSEPLHSVRLSAAQEIGAGGDPAFEALAEILVPSQVGEPTAEHTILRRPVGNHEEESGYWQAVIRAWLTPLLVGSVSYREDRAREHLGHWLEFVRSRESGPEDPGAGLLLEVGLAQGFKHAANRRRHHPYTNPGASGYLATAAEEMLMHARFWFTRLTLIQALCLWSLDSLDRHPSGRGRGSDPEALVKSWLASPNRGREHPFVLEAGDLAILALQTGQPERFIWMDETTIATTIGSRLSPDAGRLKHDLWLPPSAGWSALHPRARQLVADVVLLRNLAEHGPLSDRDRQLQRTNRNDLPPCLAGDRFPLDPMRPISAEPTWEAGSNCKDGCKFKLCPYPPKGAVPYQAELDDPFCRNQQSLLGRNPLRRRTAPWQTAYPRDLRRFWKEMEERARQA